MESTLPLLSTKVAVDIVFIGLVIVAIIITAVVIARAMTDSFSVRLDSGQAQNLDESDELKARLADPEPQTPDQNFDLSITTEQAVAPSPADQIAGTFYDSSPVILPITWGAVAGTLIWRGKVRSAWSKQGYDYDTFKLVAKMRGSPMRIRLLNAVSDSPKNKLQLAKELEVDWKTIDNHIEMLMQSRLVEERTVVGTARYYALTQNGTKVLSLLSADKIDS